LGTAALKYYLIQNPESAKERRGGVSGVASELEVVKMNFGYLLESDD
jgi:hypothetical protein